MERPILLRADFEQATILHQESRACEEPHFEIDGRLKLPDQGLLLHQLEQQKWSGIRSGAGMEIAPLLIGQG
jgi:hypothetical protein